MEVHALPPGDFLEREGAAYTNSRWPSGKVSTDFGSHLLKVWLLTLGKKMPIQGHPQPSPGREYPTLP